MGDEVKEACGIAAISMSGRNGFKKEDLVHNLYKMLLRQQHRGQLSAGITTFDSERNQILKTYKELFHLKENNNIYINNPLIYDYG